MNQATVAAPNLSTAILPTAANRPTGAVPALRDFYTDHTHLIQEAVAAHQASHRDALGERQAEFDSVTAHLAKTNGAIDRYLTAFETGKLDADALATRAEKLAEQARQLRLRRDMLTLEIESEPAPPPPAQLATVREHVIDVLTHGSPADRKALCDALIHELRITASNTVQPTFRVPLTDGPHPEAASDRPDVDRDGVRAFPRLVGPAGHNTNTYVTVAGPVLAVATARQLPARKGQSAPMPD